MAEQRRQAGEEGRGGGRRGTHIHKHTEIHTDGDAHAEARGDICMGMYANKHADDTTYASTLSVQLCVVE